MHHVAERRRQRRLTKNRAAAARSRERKKLQWANMEAKLAGLLPYMPSPHSFSQVYKAVLRETGETVAVKVQRPGVEPVILRDLFIFRCVSSSAIKAEQRGNTRALLAVWQGRD